MHTAKHVTKSLERALTLMIELGNGGSGNEDYDPDTTRADLAQELRLLASMVAEGAPIPSADFAAVRIS